MNIYSVNMIDVADLRDAINIQYDCRASCMDISLALGAGSYPRGARQIYFGPDYIFSTNFLEHCIITYLQNTLPNEENVFVNFDT